MALCRSKSDVKKSRLKLVKLRYPHPLPSEYQKIMDYKFARGSRSLVAHSHTFLYSKNCVILFIGRASDYYRDFGTTTILLVLQVEVFVGLSEGHPCSFRTLIGIQNFKIKKGGKDSSTI